MTVPLPTSQAAMGVALFRQAPPSTVALASSPGGSLSVRFLAESPLLGLNLMSVPRFAVEPAVADAGESVSAAGPIDAHAAGATAAAAPTTAAHTAIRRHIVGRCFPGSPEPNPPGRRALPGRGPADARHEFLMTMPSMMLAARSAASMAASRRSKMSFQRITTMGSIPPSNSDATASRVMRSPSFSSRLTSTV